MKKLAITLLTMNVAGIPIVHPRWDARRRALGEDLRRGGYDVVVMQEAWRDKDAAALSAASGLPYYARVERDVALGTGLAVLSRWPIVERRELVFTCRPSKLRVLNGEPIANKGALLVRVETPAGPLDVYDTHLIADYPDAPYKTLRLTQLFELSQFVLARSSATPFVLAGDLNLDRGDGSLGLLEDLLGVSDVCERQGKDACGPTVVEDWAGARRLDHVLVPDASAAAAAATTAFAPLPDGEPLSDHKGVAARLTTKVLRGRLSPDPARRLAALARLDAALGYVIDAMNARKDARSWIPIYGFLLSARYDHQLEQLYDLRDEIETARIRTLHGTENDDDRQKLVVRTAPRVFDVRHRSR